MMRPDEFRKKMAELEGLERAVALLLRAETISSGNLYYNGHQGTSLTEDELVIVRLALCEHYRTKVDIKAAQLRNAGIDPSSIVSPQERADG